MLESGQASIACLERVRTAALHASLPVQLWTPLVTTQHCALKPGIRASQREAWRCRRFRGLHELRSDFAMPPSGTRRGTPFQDLGKIASPSGPPVRYISDSPSVSAQMVDCADEIVATRAWDSLEEVAVDKVDSCDGVKRAVECCKIRCSGIQIYAKNITTTRRL